MLTSKRISCVVARMNQGAEPGKLAIADIVADHRAEHAADEAAAVFARLPGCEIFLAPDNSHGYLAFTRDGTCFEIRAKGDGDVSAQAAEACAEVLYARSCVDHPASLLRTSSA